ncbi:50S ribosomal protein L10 [Terriglobus sp.]|uniref:50S ribosomal protein L10 n=1 Tax=Terriglobus sp. TaxID=1889013 RepID=UPI003B00EC17
MALTKQQKNLKVAALASNLETATSAIIGTFTAMTALKDFELRKTIREAGGRYQVLKNKLAPKAGAGTRIEEALGGLKGVSSIAYTSGDPVALAKALSTWVKDNAQFTFKLGIVDGKVINVAEINNLATLPGKEELFSKLLFLINAPATRLATVMNATGRNMAVVIDQAVQGNKFAGAAAPVAESTPAAESATATEATPVAEAAPAAEASTSTDADPAQPESGDANQAGAAATEAPVEG